MIISLISILTINRVIGRENTIPWYFSEDINWFKYHTMNKPVIMGRKTFESIGKKPLSGRFNIVLSNQLLQYNTKFNNIVILGNVEQALFLVKEFDEIMIIGGSKIYNVFIDYCNRMYLTYINVVYNYGDTWFPKYNCNEWKFVFNRYLISNTRYNRFYELNFRIIERC